MKTKNILLTLFAILGLALLTTPATQAQTCDGNGKNFVDLNGDGFNDNAPDHDGDGIPNGLDEDYVKAAQDGTGYKNGKLGENKSDGMTQTKTMAKTMTMAKGMTQQSYRFQAFNGNLFQQRIGALGGMTANGVGICDGNFGDIAGFGICDGTGPHGGQKQSGK